MIPHALLVGSLLIIAPDRFRDTLAPFVEFKNSRLHAEFVGLDRVLHDGRGADDAEKLKHYLFDQWHAKRGDDAEQVRYVLLVGDADIMPVRYMVLDRNTDAAFHYAFYPSDLYYADLARANKKSRIPAQKK